MKTHFDFPGNIEKNAPELFRKKIDDIFQNEFWTWAGFAYLLCEKYGESDLESLILEIKNEMDRRK